MKPNLLIAGRDLTRWREAPEALAQLHRRWETFFASNAQEAEVLLRHTSFDAIVADFNLDGGGGQGFLQRVLSDRPQVHRFLVADVTDPAVMRQCFGTAHQFLAKPCSIDAVLAALERARQVDIWFASPPVQALVAQMTRIPSPPATYFQIVKALQNPAAEVEAVGELIAGDPALTAKLLHLVNSAAFGLPRQITHPTEAVLHIGFETTKSLVLLAHTYSKFNVLAPAYFSVDKLWHHSSEVARYAKLIAREETGDSELADACFTAGLLHDLGKLMLAVNCPEKFMEAVTILKERHCPGWEAEQLVFGGTHADVGAWLAAIWGLPLPIVEALALHHYPAQLLSKEFCPLTAVHVANALLHQQPGATSAAAQIDTAYLAALKLDDRVPVWQSLLHPVQDASQN